MGKSVQKIFSKVATIGSGGMNKLVPGGWASPVESALAGEASPLDGITGAAATRAAAQAAEQQAALARQAQIIQTNAQAVQANSANDNTANVVAGGTADDSDATGSDLKRRARTTVSSTLGI